MKTFLVPRNGILCIRSSKVGLGEVGVEATREIKAGQAVFEIVGPVKRYATIYTFQIGKHEHIDPRDDKGKPGLGHFTNHSCNPSAAVTIIEKDGKRQIIVVARKKIRPEEAITVDYAVTEFNPQVAGMSCKCGSENCRGKITGYKDLPEKVKKTYKKEGIVLPYLIEMERVNSA